MSIYAEKIGFIGLGKLGMPCAEAVASKGFEVVGYDVQSKQSSRPHPFVFVQNIPYIPLQKHLGEIPRDLQHIGIF